MDAFIKLAAEQFGLSEANASKSTGVLLGLIQQFVGGDLADRFFSQLPGAEALLKAATSGGGGGLGSALGGLLGGEKSGLGGLLGKIAGGADALGALKSAGLEASQLDDFVGAFSDFAQGEAGEDLTHQVIGQLRSKLL
jgi:hypothetical protein